MKKNPNRSGKKSIKRRMYQYTSGTYKTKRRDRSIIKSYDQQSREILMRLQMLFFHCQLSIAYCQFFSLLNLHLLILQPTLLFRQQYGQH
jgi:hypothetical protein